MDIMNKFGVGLYHRAKEAPLITIRNLPILIGKPYSFTPEDALLLAAWLVATAEPFADEKFDTVLEQVKNT